MHTEPSQELNPWWCCGFYPAMVSCTPGQIIG